MFERILAAIDESETAERVLATASELASLSDGEVWVLHVWEGEPSKYKSLTATSNEDAHLMVEAAARKLTDIGIRAHADIAANLYGYAAREITGYARTHGVGVIVMGSRGRSDLAGLLTGSTAHKVIHTADRPVVIVR